MIKTRYYFAFLLIASSLQAQSAAKTSSAQLSITKLDGGSAVTDLSADIKVNKGSSLHRRVFVINDASCPITLGELVPKTEYTGSRGEAYHFIVHGKMTVNVPVVAYHLVFPIFDVWGDRMKNLVALDVKDVTAGPTTLEEKTWYATENEVAEYFTAAAFIDKVMTADGKIWRADRKAIAQHLAAVQIVVSDQGLDPEAAGKIQKK